MTNKKITELVQATQVNDVDELAIVQSGQTKRVTKQVLQDSLSVESGTTINLESLGTMDNTQTSDFDTGKSSVFNLGGVLGGTIGFDTSTQIRGKQSFLYTNNATASNSNEDWVSRTLDVPTGYIGRLFEFNFQYINQFQNGNIRVKLIDDLGNILIDKELSHFVDSDYNSATEFSQKILINKSVSSITWGFQVVNGESSAELRIDDVQITPNIRATQEQVFISGSDSSIRFAKSNFVQASNGNYVLTLGQPILKLGSSITFVSNSVSGDYFIAEDSGIYHIAMTTDTLSANTGFARNLESSDFTTSNSALSAEKTLLPGYENQGYVLEASWSGYLERGDRIYVHTGGAWSQNNNAYNTFSISKVGSADAFPALKDQKVELNISEVTLREATAFGTGAEARTVLYSEIEKATGNALSVNNSNGTVITVNKRGWLSGQAIVRQSKNADFIISKNAPDNTTWNSNIFGKPYGLAGSYSDAGSDSRGHAAFSFTSVEPGDKIRVSAPSGSFGSTDQSIFHLTFLEPYIEVTVNNIVPQFEDMDSYISVTNGNGSGSTNTLIKKFSALESNVGSDVEYVPSATLGDSFVIKSKGVYHITYSDNDSVTARDFGISKNANVGTIFTNLTPSERLAGTTTNAANYVENCSWSGILEVGDVIRAHHNNFLDGTVQSRFSITKVSKPSVIGIDGRPIDAYQQKSDSSIELDGGNGHGSTNTKVRRFKNVIRSNGSSVNYVDSPTFGSYFEILEDGVFNISYNDANGAANICGIGRNITDFVSSLNSLTLAQGKLAQGGMSADTGTGHCSWSGELRTGDIITFHQANAATSDSPYIGATISKVGSVVRSIPLIDSTVDIPNSEVRMQTITSKGSTNTIILKFDELESIKGDALSIDSSDGTFITIKKDGYVSISSSVGSSAAATDAAIYLNPTDTTSSPSLGALTNQILASGTTGNPNWVTNLAWGGYLKAGDQIAVAMDSTPSGLRAEKLSVYHQETEVAVALSNVQPQFEDVDTMIRVTTANGYGSAGTKITRYSGVEQIKGAAVTYQDSVTNGASFTINESGVYGITVVGSNSVGAGIVGVSRNASSLTTDIYGLPSNERLVEQETETAGYRISASGTFYLEAGDIIRPHNAGAAQNNNLEHSFTIVKQAVPSIAEVDITPFADLNQQVYQATEWKTYIPFLQGFGNATEVNFIYRENGPTVDIIGSLRTGVRTPDEFRVGLPNSRTVTSLFTSIKDVGELQFGNTTTAEYTLLVEANQGYFGLGYNTFASGPLVRSTGSTALGDNVVLTFRASIPVNEQSAYNSEYERVYAVEDNENTFSARVNNNGTATIASQNVEFIDSVSRDALGVVTVNFKAGFFTETPAITVNLISANVAATFMNTVDPSASSVVVRSADNGGIFEDKDFIIEVTRQGSDYKDLQRQIVSLKEFPKVNNTLTQTILHSANQTTPLDLVDEVRLNLNNLSYSGSSLIQAEDDAANTRTKFVALRDCTVDFSFSALPNSNAVPFINKNGALLIEGSQAYTATARVGASARLDLREGDYLTFGAGTLSSNATYPLNVVINATAQELKSVGNLAGGENTFAAKIANNGTATVTSSSYDFIESVNRTTVGQVTINFKPGFFSETPSIIPTINAGDPQGWASITDASKDSVEIQSSFHYQGVQYYAYDYDFDLVVQRQGNDVKDPQEHIIQLDDFPRVNKTLMEWGHWDSWQGYSSGNTFSPYCLERYNNIGTAARVINNSTDGFYIEALRDCRVRVNGSITADQHFGWALNPTSGELDVSILSLDNTKKIAGIARGRSGSHVFHPVSLFMSKGDKIHFMTDGVAISTDANAGVSVSVEFDQLERVDNVDAAENVFSAQIFNNGVSAILNSQSSNFIQSVNRPSAGRVDITFVPGFFTTVPTVTATANGSSGNRWVIVDGQSTSGCTIYGDEDGGSSVDTNFDIVVIRQGSDYKSIQDVVVALPESKTKYQKKFLTANVTTSAAVTDLSFNNLELGKTYRLTARMQGEFTANNGTTQLLWTNDGNTVGKVSYFSNEVITASITLSNSFVFIATSTTLVCNSLAAGTYLIAGNNTSDETFAMLEELPLHEQTSQWT